MKAVGPSEWLWKEGSGYYTQQEVDLRQNPHLPNERFIRDQRMIRLLSEDGGLSSGSEILELGCGASPWLPYLARTIGCIPSGIELEPYAANLARANLAGAGVNGHIYCRDAFNVNNNEDLFGRFDLVFSNGLIEHLEDVSEKLTILGRYLKPGGRLISMVPNLQGVNWYAQYLGSLRVLDAHVVYDTRLLQEVHERAGFKTVAAKYLGFFDGFLTSASGESSHRILAHRTLCRVLALSSVAWSRLRLPTGEWRWTSPLVVYVGVQAADFKGNHA